MSVSKPLSSGLVDVFGVAAAVVFIVVDREIAVFEVKTSLEYMIKIKILEAQGFVRTGDVLRQIDGTMHLQKTFSCLFLLCFWKLKVG